MGGISGESVSVDLGVVFVVVGVTEELAFELLEPLAAVVAVERVLFFALAVLVTRAGIGGILNE